MSQRWRYIEMQQIPNVLYYSSSEWVRNWWLNRLTQLLLLLLLLQIWVKWSKAARHNGCYVVVRNIRMRRKVLCWVTKVGFVLHWKYKVVLVFPWRYSKLVVSVYFWLISLLKNLFYGLLIYWYAAGFNLFLAQFLALYNWKRHHEASICLINRWTWCLVECLGYGRS